MKRPSWCSLELSELWTKFIQTSRKEWSSCLIFIKGRAWNDIWVSYKKIKNKWHPIMGTWKLCGFLSSSGTIDSRMNYKRENPVQTGWVEKSKDYVYCSERNCSELLILLEFILYKSEEVIYTWLPYSGMNQ